MFGRSSIRPDGAGSRGEGQGVRFEPAGGRALATDRRAFLTMPHFVPAAFFRARITNGRAEGTPFPGESRASQHFARRERANVLAGAAQRDAANQFARAFFAEAGAGTVSTKVCAFLVQHEAFLAGHGGDDGLIVEWSASRPGWTGFAASILPNGPVGHRMIRRCSHRGSCPARQGSVGARLFAARRFHPGRGAGRCLLSRRRSRGNSRMKFCADGVMLAHENQIKKQNES